MVSRSYHARYFKDDNAIDGEISPPEAYCMLLVLSILVIIYKSPLFVKHWK